MKLWLFSFPVSLLLGMSSCGNVPDTEEYDDHSSSRGTGVEKTSSSNSTQTISAPEANAFGNISGRSPGEKIKLLRG